MKKMVVTGGAGFIGSHIVDALIARGDEVHVIDNYASGKYEDRLNAKATYHDLDIRKTADVQKILEGTDVVFHTAALPRVAYSVEHPMETSDTNVLGTASVLTAAKDAKVRRVVYSASGSAYGEQETMPLTETMPANPINPYGLQKHVGELFMRVWSRTYGIETVSLRYFNVYGSRIDPHGPYALAIGAFLLARKEGRPLTIFGDGTITRDYTHVRDAVRANFLAADSTKVGKGEVINIGAGRNVTIQMLAEMIGGEITYGPPRIEAHDSKADNSLAKELLGWEPTIALEEGIAELEKRVRNCIIFMIIDGRAIAEDLYAKLAERRAHMPNIRLGIVVGGADPVIEQFIKIKSRAAARLNVEIIRRDLQHTPTTEEAIALVHTLAGTTDGVIVQLPLPKAVQTEKVLCSIPLEYDVDAINPSYADSDRIARAPVAEAIVEILSRSNISPKGQSIAVVGEGRLVGAPTAVLLQEMGAHVTIVLNTHRTLEDVKKADIVILGAGDPGFVKPEHLKSGVVLIDAGTSESGGKVVGDADPSCAEVASIFTPVPGGVGPIAVAMLFKNLFNLVDAKK